MLDGRCHEVEKDALQDKKFQKWFQKGVQKNEGFSTGVMIDGVESSRKTGLQKKYWPSKIEEACACSIRYFLLAFFGKSPWFNMGSTYLDIAVTHAQSNIDSNEFCMGDSWGKYQ